MTQKESRMWGIAVLIAVLVNILLTAVVVYALIAPETPEAQDSGVKCVDSVCT